MHTVATPANRDSAPTKPPSQAIEPAALKSKLVGLFRSPDYQPPVLPSIAMELYSLSQNPDTQVKTIADLMGRDPVLAGQVLRLAQSASYSTRQPLCSLKDAVVRLGVRRVCGLFVRACAESRLFRTRVFANEMEALRRHCVLTAELARRVARLANVADEPAYLCGLLHDVGSAGAVLAMVELGVEAPFHEVRDTVFELHESCSEFLAKVWGLPADVAQVLALHHNLVLDGKDGALTVVVALADALCQEVGLGFFDESPPKFTEAAARSINLDKAALASLREFAKTAATNGV